MSHVIFTVKMPNGKSFDYNTFEKVVHGRIYARAWAAYIEKEKPKHPHSWANFARYLGVAKPKPWKGVNASSGSWLYGWINDGNLPLPSERRGLTPEQAEAAKQKLFELSGYPWD